MSITEVIVALVLLGVGVLALAGTSVFVTRSAGESARASFAAARLLAIADSLRSVNCARVVSGTAGINPLRVAQRWRAYPAPEAGAIDVQVEAEWRAAHGGTRHEQIEAVIPCP